MRVYLSVYLAVPLGFYKQGMREMMVGRLRFHIFHTDMFGGNTAGSCKLIIKYKV